MPYKIINKQALSSDIKRLDVQAPEIAKKALAGQYVSIIPSEGDERIPLSIVESDAVKGTITLIIQQVGPTTRKLADMAINEEIFSIIGPLGMPAKIEKKGNVVLIATGIGTAQMLSIARALKTSGNKIIGVIGAKTKKALMLEAQMRLACNKIFITTNDGSYERKGLATDMLKTLMTQQEVHAVYAIGSVEMMQTVCSMTEVKKIPTYISVSPVMIDCMGMCGSCRMQVGGETVLACIDGPVFNGHEVDFDDLLIRMNANNENQLWRSQSQQPSPRPSETKTFKRFLTGILKS